MANKRIRKKRAKMSGKSRQYKPKNLFRSDMSIASTEVDPEKESKLVQTASRELSQLSYYFWFKDPIQLEDVTRDDIKYLASGKMLKSFQANIEPMLRVATKFADDATVKRHRQLVVGDYLEKHNIKSVRGLQRAINKLNKQVEEFKKELRASPRGRKMLKAGYEPSLFTLVYYLEKELK